MALGAKEMIRLITIAVVCTLLLIPIAGFSSNIISNVPLLTAVSFGLAYVAIPAFLLQIWPAQKVQKFKSMQDALWDGELVSVDYEVRDVAQIEEMEDEGLHFLVAIETGQTLFLSGQYLYGLLQRHVFPSERVRVFTNKVTNLQYGIEPIGRSLATWSIYDPFTEDRSQSEIILEDGRLYSQTIADIVAEVGLKPAKANKNGEKAV
jgi:hypothetical protein